MRKSAFVPDFWIQSDLGDSALRTLLVLNLHRDGNNCCYVTNDELAANLGKDVSGVKADLRRALKLGLIERRFDQKGRRHFYLILKECPEGENHPPREISNPQTGGENFNPGGRITTPQGGEFQPPRGENITPLPQTPLYRNNLNTTYKSTCNSHEANNTHTDQNNPIEAIGKKPKPIPDQILRMASQIGLEGWVGEVQFQEIDPDDWRVKETLVRIKGTGKKVNGRYAWQIFNGLPEVKPPAEAVGFKTLKVDHMPNVMPPLPEKSEFSAIKTEYYNRLGDLTCDFSIINSLMEAIDAEPKQGQPSEYRNRLEAIYRDTLRLNGSHK